MRTNLLAAAFAAGALATGGPAAAAKYVLTYQGVVASGFDSGLFGIVGDLAGQDFTAVYTIDTATPGATLLTGAGTSDLRGSGAASPVSATLTINGVTRTFGALSGVVYEMDGPTSGFGLDSQTAGARDSETICASPGVDCVTYERSLFFGVGSFGQDLSDGDVTTPPPGATYTPSDFAFGSFSDYQVVEPGNPQSTRASATFRFQNLTVAAVPEPSAWALMIMGFGATGAALRRRRAPYPALAK